MLFVQQIEIEYRKNVRYANFAQARNAIKFYPVRINPDEIQQNVLFHSAFFIRILTGCTIEVQKVGSLQKVSCMMENSIVLPLLKR